MSSESSSSPIHVVCPHCHKTVALLIDQLNAETANCGSCHQPLLMGEPVNLDGESFPSIGRSQLPVVVDFWAVVRALPDDGACVCAGCEGFGGGGSVCEAGYGGAS